MESSWSSAKGPETVLGSFSAIVRKTWYPPTYDLYFTDRRIIFVKIGDYIPPSTGIIGSIASDIGEAAERHNIKERRDKYARMTLQEIADGKDNVGVAYDDIASVLVKGKKLPEIWFSFARKQKLGWEKIGFIIYGGDQFDQTVKKAGELLREFLLTRINIQLQSSKLIALFGEANPPPPPPP
jgi:hypothetical protein